MGGVVGVVAQLAAELLRGGAHPTRVAGATHAPDPLQQPVVGHHAPGADAESGLVVARGTITNSETYPLAGCLLVDAETQTALATLTHEEEASVTLDDPSGGEFAFRAVSPPDAEIGSVHLELTGARTASRTLNAEPWSLYCDDVGDLQGESGWPGIPVGY